MIGKSDQKPCTLLDYKRTVTPIIPSDDAFHGSLRHIGAEWWYFDALFADDLSIHVGYKTFSKKCAEELSWSYDEQIGDPQLIINFLEGNWNSDEFLIVQPGEKVIASHDDQIIGIGR